MIDRQKIRGYIIGLLKARREPADFSDTDSLVLSGRLDSVDVVDIVSFLETEFSVDFAKINFAPQRVDSVDNIATLIEESQSIHQS